MAEASDTVEHPSTSENSVPSTHDSRSIVPSNQEPAATESAKIESPAANAHLSHRDTYQPPSGTFLHANESSLSPEDAKILQLIDTSLPPLDTTLPAPDCSLPAELNLTLGDKSSTSCGNVTAAQTRSVAVSSPQLAPPAGSMQQGDGRSFSQFQAINGPSQYVQTSFQQQQPTIQHQATHQIDGAHYNAPIGMPSSGSPQTTSTHESPAQSTTAPFNVAGQYMHRYPQIPIGANAHLNYQIQSDLNRAMSAGDGKDKKEVKRRTKTGCLTCRKRRIKVCGRSLLVDKFWGTGEGRKETKNRQDVVAVGDLSR